MAMLRRSLSFFERFRLVWRKPDKLHQFIVFFSRHWRLRIVSVVLAIGVWVYVQLATNMVTVTLTVPLATVRTSAAMSRATSVRSRCAARATMDADPARAW